MAAPLIDQLVNKRDTFELVRDEIAAILLAETTNQQTLAAADGKDPRLWAYKVYLERANPWADWQDVPDLPIPIVNVWLNSLSFDMAGSDIVERQKASATYHIDCYAYAPSSHETVGHTPGDKQSALDLHRCVRLVRNTLMAATYTYLGMQGVVWRRWITSIEIFQPESERQALPVIAARFALAVDMNEFSPQVTGEALELLSVTMEREETGQVYFTADYSYPL